MKVGITGHQRLDNPSGWSWVKLTLKNELDALAPPLIAVSSLAIGTDQLFASIAVHCGGQIHAIIPFQDYERTFSQQDLNAYCRILSKATIVEIMQTDGTDEEKYLAAGKRIVELTELLFAVWDGKPAKGLGGTADVVAYAIQQGTRLIHINPINHSVTRR